MENFNIKTKNKKILKIQEDFYNTSAFVSALENRQGLKIACLEEIAFNNKCINKKNIIEAIKFYGKCNYSQYLSTLIKKDHK